MVYQDNLLITLNSKNATLLNNSLKSSVNFNFVSTLKEEDDIIRTYFSVINAQIPMSYYVITSANNRLLYNTMSPSAITTLFIPVGNYNSYTLCSMLTSLFLTNGKTITITTNSYNGIINFSQTSGIKDLKDSRHSLNRQVLRDLKHNSKYKMDLVLVIG